MNSARAWITHSLSWLPLTFGCTLAGIYRVSLKSLQRRKKLHTSNLHIIIRFLLFSIILIYHWFPGNVKWQEGRVSGTVYCGSKELTDLLTKVFFGLEAQWYFIGERLSNLFYWSISLNFIRLLQVVITP